MYHRNHVELLNERARDPPVRNIPRARVRAVPAAARDVAKAHHCGLYDSATLLLETLESYHR